MHLLMHSSIPYRTYNIKRGNVDTSSDTTTDVDVDIVGVGVDVDVDG